MSTCTTATLIRGKKYSYFYAPIDPRTGERDHAKGKFYSFERHIAQVLPPDVAVGLADDLDELVDVVSVGDGDEVEKQIFRVDRDAPLRVKEPVDPDRPKRLRLVSADEVRKPKPRPLPRGLGVRKIG